MKKRTLTILIVAAVLVVLALSVYNFTGNSVISLPTGCSDTDNPNGDLSLKDQAIVIGTATYSNRDAVYTDYCVEPGTTKLNEYYCQGRIIKSDRRACDAVCEACVCVGGACVKESA